MGAALDLLSETARIAEAVRPELEARIRAWRASARLTDVPETLLTAGMCRGASIGLASILAEELPDVRWRIDGGWGADSPSVIREPAARERVDIGRWPGGMLADDGEWRGHFWVRGEALSGEAVIADITADQFGYGKVTVSSGTDPRYRPNLLVPAVDDCSSAEMRWGAGLHCTFTKSRQVPRERAADNSPGMAARI